MTLHQGKEGIEMNEKVKLFAHRGVSGEYPENTMAAFKAAVEMGADGIELDVQLTKDGQVVVIHDETINRTTNGIGYVKDFEWKQLRRYDAGSWFDPLFINERIPLLEEVLELVKDRNPHMLMNIELKNDLLEYPHLEEKVLEIVNKLEMKEQTIISSFNSESLVKVNQLDPTIETAFLFAGIPTDIMTRIKTLPIQALHCEASFAQSIIGRKIRDMGMPLRVFTINSLEEFTLLKKEKVPVIITDYPHIFLNNL